jgi:hypothetical protein
MELQAVQDLASLHWGEGLVEGACGMGVEVFWTT